MTRFYISTGYDADEGAELDSIAGQPVGIPTAEWPRRLGQPMQHLATIDLEDRAIGLPLVDDGRALMVFVDSYHTLDLGDPSAVAIRIVTQADIDEHGETSPPPDHAPEPYPRNQGKSVSLEVTEDEIYDEDSVLGGELCWPEETGAPETIPDGRFVVRLVGILGQGNTSIYGFEGGAIAVGLYEPDEDEDEEPSSWEQALALTRELVISDEAPESPLFKLGGAPPAFFEHGWPTDSRDRPLTHLMTIPADVLRVGREPEDEDEIATSFFFDRRRASLETSTRDNLIVCESVCEDDLNEDGAELPEGVELLPEKRLSLRELEGDIHWRGLLGRHFIGPRGVFHNHEAVSATSIQLQFEASLVPGVTREGTFYVDRYSDCVFQAPGDVGVGGDDDDDDYDDYDDYDDGDDSPAAAVSSGLRVLTLEGGTRSYVGGLPPDIGIERWPRYEGELMTHVITLNVADIPDLAGHDGAALSVFLSTANHHEAFAPYSAHAAVVAVTSEEFERRAEAPEGEVLEILAEQSLGIRELDDGEPLPASFAGGRPRWIQQGQGAGSFVAQFDENLVDVNLGDCGTLYVFDDTAFFQCY